jgi:putative membrane protein
MHMFGGFGMIFMILFWGFIIALLISLSRDQSSEDTPPPSETSLDIVKKRFARGEIDKEEFESKKRDLA